VVFPDESVVFDRLLLFEAQHLSQLFRRLNHQTFHFVIRDTAVARLVKKGGGFAGMEILQEPVPKSIRGDGVRLVPKRELASRGCLIDGQPILGGDCHVFGGGKRWAQIQEHLLAATAVAVLIVVHDPAALDGIDVPDKEPVPVEIGGADDEIFGREFLWCRHVNDGKRATLKSNRKGGGVA